jgi:RNA polymerase sigma-70 factor (ECF subfamily)
MTDDELAGFRAGDSEVFARLVAEYSPRLLGAAMQLTRDRAVAHDLVQDTWVHAFEARATFERRGSILGWLLSVMRSRHLADWRAEARRAARTLAHAGARDTVAVNDGGDDLLMELDLASRRARLLSAVSGLPPRQRDVLVCRVFEECSVAETARRLGIAEGTVKSTLAQAIARLRTTLGGAE